MLTNNRGTLQEAPTQRTADLEQPCSEIAGLKGLRFLAAISAIFAIFGPKTRNTKG